MTFYGNMAATALRMIADKGRSITVVTPAGQSYNPATDAFTAGTPTTVAVKGVFTDFETKDIDGTNVLRSDKRVLIAAASLAAKPGPADSITDGSDTYRVIDTDTVQPGDTPLLYMVQVRR